MQLNTLTLSYKNHKLQSTARTDNYKQVMLVLRQRKKNTSQKFLAISRFYLFIPTDSLAFLTNYANNLRTILAESQTTPAGKMT